MTESAILDAVDRGLVHALAIDGRAPLRAIAAVIGVSENTVARRYRRLREAGVIRVVGALNGARLGYTSWTIRIGCTPDSAASVAAALAARADTSWVHLLSGGTEISCNVQAPSADERDALLLQGLPRAGRVISISAHLLLQSFALPGGWAGIHALSRAQIAALRPEATPIADGAPIALDRTDRALLGALARDGRTSHAELASRIGAPESTARRRLDRLRSSGVLVYQLDVSPEALGYRADARLWMEVAPSAVVSTATALAKHPEVSFAAVTTGRSNLVAAVHCRDTQHLYRYLAERVGAIQGVHHVETAPVVRTVKRAGTLMPAS